MVLCLKLKYIICVLFTIISQEWRYSHTLCVVLRPNQWAIDFSWLTSYSEGQASVYLLLVDLFIASRLPLVKDGMRWSLLGVGFTYYRVA